MESRSVLLEIFIISSKQCRTWFGVILHPCAKQFRKSSSSLNRDLRVFSLLSFHCDLSVECWCMDNSLIFFLFVKTCSNWGKSVDRLINTLRSKDCKLLNMRRRRMILASWPHKLKLLKSVLLLLLLLASEGWQHCCEQTEQLPSGVLCRCVHISASGLILVVPSCSLTVSKCLTLYRDMTTFSIIVTNKLYSLRKVFAGWDIYLHVCAW